MSWRYVFLALIVNERVMTYATWAEESFGVLSTEYGCPVLPNASWDMGMRSLNFPRSVITWSDNLYLIGPVTHDLIQLNGCFIGAENWIWPEANYCLIRTKASCEGGFKKKDILHEDFSVQDVGGVFWDTDISDNVLLPLCCAEAMEPGRVLDLPFQSPFILIKHHPAQPCPSVSEYTSHERSVTVTDEDVGEETTTINMCFYQHKKSPTEMLAQNCPADWLFHGGYCYYFSNESLSWFEARDTCHKMQSNLVSITNEEEETFLAEEMQIRKSVSLEYYLGLSDIHQEGTWVWEDKVPTEDEYMNWHPIEPNDSMLQEDCAFFKIDTGNWDDINCFQQVPFICKRVATPEPHPLQYVRKVTSSSLADDSLAEFATDEHLGTCFLSRQGHDQWFQADLGQLYDVNAIIIIVGKVHLKSAAFYVGFTPTDFHNYGARTCSSDVTTRHMTSLIHCVQPVTGRYVTILQRNTDQGREGIQICDLRIFARASYCGMPLGVSTGEVPAVQFSASSYTPPYWPHHARLHADTAWCAGPEDKTPYLQVNFGRPFVVQAIELKQSSEETRVETFTLMVGPNSTYLVPVRDVTQAAKEFKLGDTSSTLFHLTDSITTEVLQINLLEFSEKACLKLELYGCEEKKKGTSCQESVGYPTVELPRQPARGLYFLFDLSCPGIISQIHYHAATRGSFSIQTWRVQGDLVTGPTNSVDVNVANSGVHHVDINNGLQFEDGDIVSISGNPTIPVTFALKDDVEVMAPDLHAVHHLDLDLHSLLADKHNISINLSEVPTTYMVFSLHLTIEQVDDVHISDVPCGGILKSGDTIYSPNYPEYYGQHQHCVWTISSFGGQYIMFEVVQFDLLTENEYGCADTLSVFALRAGSRHLLHEASGDVFPLIMVDDQNLEVEFQSCIRNSPQHRAGFMALVSFQDCAGCGIGTHLDNLTCTNPCGYLATPNYPHPYPVHSQPTWHITVATGTYIRLELGTLKGVQSELPTCLQDYVEIFDYNFEGKRKSLGVYCNARPPPPVLYSSWHIMTVEFVSDEEFTATGFKATYTSARFSLPDSVKENINTIGTECPSSWIQYGRNCYIAKTLVQGTSWLGAEAMCLQNGGHLVSIMDEEEMLVIHYFLTSVWQMSETKTYIGLTDHNHEGQFRWSDSRPMIYTAWANTSTSEMPQPDGGELEDCTIIQLANLYFINQWHDVPCALNDVKQLICKLSLDKGSTEKLNIPPNNSIVSFPADISLHLCKSGEYIREVYLCDGELHCKDGSDEAICTTCEENQFQCGDDYQCIHVSKYCDFILDCQNGADEAKCVMPSCSLEEFHCSNGQCIDARKRCNLIADCVDQSDEENCETCQRPDTFQCYDGRCIPWHTRCDRVKDCSGCTIEDEKGCFKTPFSLCNDVIQCDWRPLDGYGAVILSHDLDADNLSRGSSHAVISYLGLDTDDEVLAIMEMSFRCEQSMELGCPGASGAIFWESFTSQTWMPDVFTECNTNSTTPHQCSTVVTDKSALPVKTIMGNMSVCGDSTPILLGPLMCFVEVGAQEVGSEMTCNNGQRTLSKYQCLFEEDQYGVQQGCRDMSHLQDCGSLAVAYTECLRDSHGMNYRGTVTTTQSGWTCQRWDMQTPHGHPFTQAESFGEETLSDAHNFCRNPFGPGVPPFCFTVDPDRRYEFCDIPSCGNDTQETWTYKCPHDYVQCPGNYCIPLQYVCDGHWHCANGEDEAQCESYHCEGRYACTGRRNCLPFHALCDGKKDCFHGDDEYLCDVTCPANCTCHGLAVNCSSIMLLSIPDNLDMHIRTMDLSFNTLQVINGDTVYLPFISKLNLADNEISEMRAFQFIHMRNLLELDLQNNRLRYIPHDAFQNLANLHILLLEGNKNLQTLEPYAFDGLSSLTALKLTHMQITNLNDDTFIGLHSLTELDLSSNTLQELSTGSFNGIPKLKQLGLAGNDIKLAFRQTFRVLPNLTHLTSDKFKFCCLAEQVPREHCFPPQDPISSCEDLMNTNILRSFLWILGLMALIGNVFVISWRLRYPAGNVPEIIINNLALSDLQMGFYMIILAGVDMYYKGVFIEYSDQWKESWLCQLAGFLGTLSSEGSVMFLCLLTIDRFINILFPFSSFKLDRKRTRIASTFVWILAFISSAVPFLPLDYFGGNFYGRSGVCLALPITNEQPAGWEFSTVVFIAFNLIAFLIIAVGYLAMYFAVSQSRAKAAAGMQRRQQLTMARNMMIIVATDFICWLPIICMGLAALNGASISGEVYAWVVVFVLPVNSAINPILYTISSLNIKEKLFGRKGKKADSETASIRVAESSRLSSVYNGRKDAGLTISLPTQNVAQPLKAYCLRPEVDIKEACAVVSQAVNLLSALHTYGIVHGDLTTRSIRIVQYHMTSRVQATLSNTGQLRPADSESDFAEDVLAFGNVIKELLQSLKGKESIFNKEEINC